MFDSKLTALPAVPDSLSTRARDAGTAAAQTAQSAAQTAQTAMRQGVYVARGWAAPRLENAADYCTATVAPRVAETLRSTARQVSPDDTRSRRLRSALSVSVITLAAAAAAGAVAVVIRRQYKAAMDADTENDIVEADEDTDEPEVARPMARSA